MTVMKASDLLKAADIHANRPAANAVPTGALYSCTTHNLIYRSDGSAWSTWATLGSTGGASVPSASVQGSGTADIQTVSTTMVDVTGLSLTIAATAGQKLLAHFTGSVYNTTTGDVTDAAINIGGTDRVDNVYVSPGVTVALPMALQTPIYTVVSGDISGGVVTVKLRWKTSAHTAFMCNSSGRLPTLTVLNLG